MIGLNQLGEAYRAGLIPIKSTSKITGYISVGNVIGLVDEKKVMRFSREFPGNVLNGIITKVPFSKTTHLSIPGIRVVLRSRDPLTKILKIKKLRNSFLLTRSKLLNFRN